jgi:hypothetical protein
VPREPEPDPVLVQRARAARLADLGQRIGYGLFGVAIVVFFVGFAVDFRPAVVTIIVAALVVGSAVLAPAIVVGYGVKAADRHDQGLSDGH